MACFGGGRVGMRGTPGNVARVLRYAVGRDLKPARSTVLSLTGAKLTSFPASSRSPFSLPLSHYCIRTATASRGYGTDGEAGRIYRSLESSPDGKKLCVSWADGEESTYHAVWLRHNCRCPQCWDDRNAEPLVYFDSLRNVEIKTTEVSGDGKTEIRTSCPVLHPV